MIIIDVMLQFIQSLADLNEIIENNIDNQFTLNTHLISRHKYTIRKISHYLELFRMFLDRFYFCLYKHD